MVFENDNCKYELIKKLFKYITRKLKQNTMSAKQRHSLSQEQQQGSISLLDSPRANLFKNQSLLNRFRYNQIELKSKFKQYVINQKHRYPLANKYFKTQHCEEQEEELDLHIIREEKKKLLEEMNHSLNQNNYLHKKKKEQEKTFYFLKNKCNKIQSIRHQRKDEKSRIQQTMKKIAKQIGKEKVKYRKNIEQSKHNITKSRLACENKKFSLAEQARRQVHEHNEYLYHERQEQYQYRLIQCKQMRQNEKRIPETLSRVKEANKIKADELKFQRLLRELAEKKQIKIASSRAKDITNRQRSSISHATKILQSKIYNFRQSLGERRLFSQSRIKLQLNYKNGSFTEGLDEFSTNSEFPYMTNYQCKTEETS